MRRLPAWLHAFARRAARLACSKQRRGQDVPKLKALRVQIKAGMQALEGGDFVQWTCHGFAVFQAACPAFRREAASPALPGPVFCRRLVYAVCQPDRTIAGLGRR
jgi:hypothetical protein